MASYEMDGDFRAEVDARLLALATEMDDADKHRAIRNAVETVYSKHKPLKKTNTISGDGTFSVKVNETNLPDFVIDDSSLRIVFPVDTTQAELNWLEDDDWMLIESGNDTVIRFLNGIVPTASQSIEFHYTYPRKFSTTAANATVTIPDVDFFAICDLAAAMCLRSIANKFTSKTNASLQADSVNHRTKAAEARSNANEFVKLWMEHMGISLKPGGGKPRAVMIAGGDQDTAYSFGGDWLTHPRAHR